MARDRFLRPRWLVYPLIAWGLLLCLLPNPALGAPLPSQAADGKTAGDWERLRQALELRIVQERLGEIGLTPEEARAKLASLTPDEVHQLAARVQEVQAGGNGAEVVAVILLALILVIVLLELMGRRVISRG